MTVVQTIIKFPDLSLKTRDAHKLRGYFGNLFKEHSPLLHNHFEDGRLRYAYPLVQYKVIDNIPYLVGMNAGARLLTDLFLKIRHIDIDGTIYPVLSKNIEGRIIEIDDVDELLEYEFVTLWMALNETNYRKYMAATVEGKRNLLKAVLQGNILSFYKGVGFWTKHKIMVKPELSVHNTLFKDKKMIAFRGTFVCNAVLPEYVGLGKAVSRGFGTIRKKT